MDGIRYLCLSRGLGDVYERQGFGAGITRKFVAEGANVMIADLNIDMANELAAELGDRVKTVQTNVAQNDSVMDMVTATVKACGQVDIWRLYTSDAADELH